jgi:putative DNA primase/helicase
MSARHLPAAKIIAQRHAQQLDESAIPIPLAERAGVHTLCGADAWDLGFGEDVGPGLAFPYRDLKTGVTLDGFLRLRLDNPNGGGRYRQPTGSGNHLYAPFATPQDLRDPSRPVILVEGEKKALALVAWCERHERPYVVIGIGGVWSWRRAIKGDLPDGGLGKIGSRPIEDLDAITWTGRSVVILFDSDILTNPDVQHAEGALSRELKSRGAIVTCARIPPGLNGAKVGADDLLAKHGDTAMTTILDAAQPTASALDEPERHIDSGVANMERLIAQHHRDVRFLYGAGWYAWDGRRFAPKAEADVVRRAIGTVRTMYGEAAGIEDKNKRTSFLNHIRRSESEPEIRRMLVLAQSHEKVYIPSSDRFDRDPMLLNLHNGTLDLRTRELHPHRREDEITKLAGCAYDPKATCPTWIAFLDTIFAGDADMIGFIQRLAGYCLTGEVREHVLPILWGDGANGKTTFINTVLALLGEYGATAPPVHPPEIRPQINR